MSGFTVATRSDGDLHRGKLHVRLRWAERVPLQQLDDLGGLGPDEGLGIGVMAVEVVVDRLLEVSNAPEGTAPDALARDLGEEALDQIEPGGAAGNCFDRYRKAGRR